MSVAFTPVDRRSSLTSRTATPEVNKAKSDLLSIGIDLDDDLISRLQTNVNKKENVIYVQNSVIFSNEGSSRVCMGHH